MPLDPSRPRAPGHPSPATAPRRLAVLSAIALAAWSTPAPAQNGGASAPAARTRALPESLNFANGLFRERRYELAAKEYERFLKDARPGPEVAEARFGLANARLFQGEYAKAREQFQAFLKLVPEHPSAPTAWYRVGETSYMLGDLPGAKQAFETFVDNYPEHKHLDTALPYLGDVCLRTGDLARARKAYEQSLKAHPDGRLADRARFGLGRSLALGGDPEAALAAFTTLAESGGKEWADRAWFQVGLVQAGAQRYAKAAEAFEKAEAVAPRSPLVAEARLNRAEALLKLDRRDEAMTLLKGLAADAPQNLAAQAAFALGTAQLEGGDAAGALATLDEASKRGKATPMAAALVFRSAEAAQKLGQADEARARFLRASEADPKDPWADDALYHAARLALDRRDFKAAAEEAETFATRFPNSPLLADARLVAARAALANGRPKDAIAILNASLADDKPSPATAGFQTYYLGMAYRADGQADRAAEVLDALARTPAAPIAADAQFMVGQGHIEAKRFAEAIGPLEKYLATKPDGEVADYALAHLVQARLETGDAEGASKALEKLATGFPKSKALPPSRLRVAEAALTGKRLDVAAEQFKLAAEAAGPGDTVVTPRARLGLGWALLDGGKPAEAAEAFGKFLEEHPDDALAPEAGVARGRALEAANQPDAALAAYQLAASKAPKSESGTLAALARARLLVAAKKPAEAAEAFAAFVDEHPDYKPKDAAAPTMDALLADWGWSLVDAEKPEEADKVFNRLLTDYPDSPHAADARFNLAESANQAKNHDEVVKLLTPLVAEGSKAAPRLVQSGLYRLGRTQAEKKDWSASAKSLDRLLAEFPDGPFRREARLLRAEVALEAGETDVAGAALTTLADEPAGADDPQGFATAVKRRRIQTLLAQKKWKAVVEAADAFKAEAATDPLVAEVDYARGRALQQLARFDDARAAFQTVIDARKGGDLVARSQLMIGETFYHQKEYHEAIRNFLKVDILYDAPAWQAAALLETGKAYEQLAQWPDAAETYERLRSKFPDDPSAAQAKGRLDDVKKHLTSATDATP